MGYDEISAAARSLGYRDKLRLAQLLIQLARREEEQQHSSSVSDAKYVAERIQKLRPATRTKLLNSIDSMYQFRGGISREDKEQLVEELVSGHGISIDQTGRVSYSD